VSLVPEMDTIAAPNDFLAGPFAVDSVLVTALIVLLAVVILLILRKVAKQ
jgi:hypothetical protein